MPDFNVRNLSLVQSIEELEANGANLYGPSFYVGSKEVFYKNWQKVWLNFNWKGKPSDFEEHYKAYVRRGVTPNYAYGLSENDFTVKVSVIENNAWRAWDYPADNDACFPEDNQKFRELFCPKIPNPFDALANICLPKDPEVQIMEFSSPARRGFVDFDKPLEVFQTATHGFIRLTLYGQDFLHKDYAYVLARQMMATGLLSQGTILDEAFYIDGEGNIVTTDIDLTEFVTERDQAIAAWTTFETHMNTTFTTAVGQANTDFAAASAQAISDASDAAAAAQALDTSIDGANPNDLLDRVTDVRTKALNASNAAIGITKLDEAKERSTQLAMMNVLNRCIQLRDFVTLKLEPFVLSAPSTSISALQVLVSPDPDSLLDFADKALTAANLAAGEADLLSGDDGGSILSVANSIDAAVTAIQDVFNFIDLAGGLKDDVNAAASITPAIVADISGPLKTKAVAALNAATLALTSAILINGPTNASILNVETSTDSTRLAAIALFNYVNATVIPLANTAVLIANNANTSISDLIDDRLADLLAAVNAAKNDALTNTITGLAFAKTQTQEVFNLIGDLNIGEAKAALIPNEPWTPAIKEFSIDYTATAEIEDIELIHLYPFEATSKPEDLRQEPTLLPTFTDEGTLFIGLHDLKPYSNLCLLMQLAEATADSELDRVKLRWSYLSGNNAWRPLRPGFELLEDGTKDLTVSGIVKIAVPGDIAPTGYSIMPTGYTWIKVAMPEADPNAEGCVVPIASRVKAVAEAVGMHAQAAKVTFHPVPLNDLQRLANSLPAGSISKLEEADFSIKKVQQPYQSFGGKLPEAAGNLYTRVSEHLRHKGRAIAPFDLERLVLDAFPEVYKAKAIGHTFGLTARGYVRDLEVAPGFVTLAVIPDLTKLRAGERSEPRCPVSLLEEIRAFLRKRMSAFARLKVMNPRYEKIDVSITVRLIKGKVQDYHASKLKEDIRLFLAPWYLGDLDKMTFGQPVTWSDMVKYVENLDYVDFIDDLKLVQVDKMPCEAHEQPIGEATHEDPCSSTAVASQVIYPLTARSILTGGEICVNISPAACDEYAEENACENTARPFGRNNKRNLIS
ncbi:MAG: hypothetical protein IPN76_17850 [Saprospiraceae bacterium]|nr:hypothetical protein [Saprospiraceae bacterium]